ncbi:hypothetical protein BJ999_003317 [Actinomadura citrea]|uniref:Uncharacterized protein n=1 Tax=Actinomadura citrea TaxID=46158 RepID=A0A7Y9GAR8_9ACTN|nr:hypothetical protein [Actinomadura citrea]GGT89012.1 hypothetical protein GCM10010177_55370 [Actinomadura citrea]
MAVGKGQRGRVDFCRAPSWVQACWNLTWLKLVRTAVVDAGEGIAEVVG